MLLCQFCALYERGRERERENYSQYPLNLLHFFSLSFYLVVKALGMEKSTRARTHTHTHTHARTHSPLSRPHLVNRCNLQQLTKKEEMEKSIKTGATHTRTLCNARDTHALTRTNVKRKYQKEDRRCSGQEERGVIDKPQYYSSSSSRGSVSCDNGRKSVKMQTVIQRFVHRHYHSSIPT